MVVGGEERAASFCAHASTNVRTACGSRHERRRKKTPSASGRTDTSKSGLERPRLLLADKGNARPSGLHRAVVPTTGLDPDRR